MPLFVVVIVLSVAHSGSPLENLGNASWDEFWVKARRLAPDWFAPLMILGAFSRIVFVQFSSNVSFLIGNVRKQYQETHIRRLIEKSGRRLPLP